MNDTTLRDNYPDYDESVANLHTVYDATGNGMVLLASACLACEKMFISNPNHVPSLNNQPICRECVEQANEKRAEMGLEPHPIHPDAYEALPEEELR